MLRLARGAIEPNSCQCRHTAVDSLICGWLMPVGPLIGDDRLVEGSRPRNRRYQKGQIQVLTWTRITTRTTKLSGGNCIPDSHTNARPPRRVGADSHSGA